MSRRKSLTTEQKQELPQAMKESQITREYKRLQAIYMYRSAVKVDEITLLTGPTLSTIARLYTAILIMDFLSYLMHTAKWKADTSY